MENKKNFKLLANQLIGLVDFIKWTSSFGTGAIMQMETPLSGITLSPQLVDLFALARDDIGWMLVMHEREGTWLKNLPIDKIFVGYSDGIIVVTDAVNIFDQPFDPIGIDIFIPHIHLRTEIAESLLMGFGLLREESQVVERVNRLVPVYTKGRYEAERIANTGQRHNRLFSQQ